LKMDESTMSHELTDTLFAFHHNTHNWHIVSNVEITLSFFDEFSLMFYFVQRWETSPITNQITGKNKR
jgi:hypothetical protein